MIFSLHSNDSTWLHWQLSTSETGPLDQILEPHLTDHPHLQLFKWNFRPFAIPDKFSYQVHFPFFFFLVGITTPWIFIHEQIRLNYSPHLQRFRSLCCQNSTITAAFNKIGWELLYCNLPITTGRERLIRTRFNSKFDLIRSYCKYFGNNPIISCLKWMVNSNMVNSKFH